MWCVCVSSYCHTPPPLPPLFLTQGLALSTFQVVLVPTLVGVLVNEFAPGFVRAIKQFLPLIGVFLTTMLCASPVGQVADVLRYVVGVLGGVGARGIHV